MASSEAVQLLTQISATMSRIEAQGQATGVNQRNPQAPTGEEIQEMMRERERMRMLKDKDKLLKSELFTALRLEKTRRDSIQQMRKISEALTQFGKAAKDDIPTLKQLKAILLDVGKGMRDVSDKDLERFRKSLSQGDAMARKLSDSLEDGVEGFKAFTEEMIDSTIASAELIKQYEDLQDVLKSTQVLTQTQQKDAARRQNELLDQMNDHLLEMTGSTATSLDDAARKLGAAVQGRTGDITKSMGTFQTALNSSSTLIYKHNRNFGQWGEKLKGLTSNPLVRAGGAVLGANMLMNKGGDGSSLLGDYFSSITTGVESPWIASADAAASLGTTVLELKRAIVQNGMGGNMTNTEMAKFVDVLSDRMGPMGAGAQEWRTAIGAAGGAEELNARLMAEYRNLSMTGQDTRSAYENTQRTLYAGRALQNASIMTADKFAELADMVDNNSVMFSTLYANGRRESSARKNWLLEFTSQSARMGFSTEQVIAKFEEAARGIDQTFQQRTEGIGGAAAMLGQLGGNQADIQKWMFARQTGNAQAETEAWQQLVKQVAPQLTALQARANTGDAQAIGALSNWAKLGGTFGTTTEITASGNQARDRERNRSDAQAAAIDDLIKMSANGNDAFDALKKVATDLYDSKLFGVAEYGAGLSKNSAAAALASVGGILLSVAGQALIGRLLFGGGAGGGLIGKLGGKIPGLGRLGGMLGARGAASGIGAAASNAPAILAASKYAGPASRLGTLGTFGGRVLKSAKGGIGGLAGGLLLDYGADAAGRDTGLGAGLDVASSALAWGGTGALIGSVIPGVGTAIGGGVGAVLGAGYGLWNNRNTIFGSDEEAAGNPATPENVAATARKSVDKMGDVEAAVNKTGMQQVDELKKMNQGIAALVDLAASNKYTAVADKRRFMRSYRLDTYGTGTA